MARSKKGKSSMLSKIGFITVVSAAAIAFASYAGWVKIEANAKMNTKKMVVDTKAAAKNTKETASDVIDALKKNMDEASEAASK